MKLKNVFLLLLIALVFSASRGIAAGSPPCDKVAEAQIAPDVQNVSETTNGAPTNVQLNGQPSKNAVTFSWVQTDGPTVVLSNATVAKPTFDAPAVGPNGATLKFKLTVTGCTGPASIAYTTINVANVETNRPPVASATVTPNPAAEGEEVTLDGTSSNDPDGDTLTYTWEQLSGTTASLNSNSLATATFTAPNPLNNENEALKFKLTVSDGYLSSSTEIIANITWVNNPPVTIMTCPEAVDEQAAVTLDGTNSYDSDDGIASYGWRQLEGLPNADLDEVNVSNSTLEFEAPTLTSKNYHTMKFGLVVTDHGGLQDSAECSIVVLDITPPVITCNEPDKTVWYGEDVIVDCLAEDAASELANSADADFTLTTNVADGTETVGAKTDSREVCDDARTPTGNCATAGDFGPFKVDKKPPTTPSFVGSITNGAEYCFGFVPSVPTCTATDAGSGLASCEVTGYSTGVGAHTLEATATDNVGNRSTQKLTYAVTPWTLSGFYQPVDMAGVYNGAKNGSTVPLKFKIFACGTELTDVKYFKSLTYAQTTCNATATTDEIETTAAGGTVLRYDTSAGQFIYNWKTPSTAGKCYRVTLTTQDGSSLVAYFKLK
jgi:hypothetical protein